VNLTLDTAERLARAVDASARREFDRAVWAHDNTDPRCGEFIAAAVAHYQRAAARREAVQRLLRRKGFVVDSLPTGFYTIVRAP
jgi:hypothetical protein